MGEGGVCVIAEHHPGSGSCHSQIHLIMFFDLNIDILVALHSGPLESQTTLNVSTFFGGGLK